MNVATRIAQERDRLKRLWDMPDSDNRKTNVAQAKRILAHLEKTYLPTGSGFDRGCSVTKYDRKAERITIEAPFHHMDEHGSYDGWEVYTVTVTPSFHGDGLNVKVKGGRDGDSRDYVADQIGYHLAQHAEEAIPLEVVMG